MEVREQSCKMFRSCTLGWNAGKRPRHLGIKNSSSDNITTATGPFCPSWFYGKRERELVNTNQYSIMIFLPVGAEVSNRL